MKTPIRFLRKQAMKILGAFFVGGLLWIFGSFFANLSFPDSSYRFLGSTKQAKLDSGKPITQIFTGEENNLNQIKIIIGDLDLQPMEKIVLELAEASCETTLARDTLTFLTPKPHIYYHFNFSPLPDSAGQTYCFKVTYFSPFDRGSDRPYLGASEGEQFAGWSYTNEGNNRTYENRTLQMRPSYGSGNFLGDLGRLNDRISQYKPAFLKGPVLTLIFCAFIVSTILLLWLLVFKKED